MRLSFLLIAFFSKVAYIFFLFSFSFHLSEFSFHFPDTQILISFPRYTIEGKLVVRSIGFPLYT